MNAHLDLQARVQEYLAERRHLGFHLRSSGNALANFARFVAGSQHSGPLTVELMAHWARQARGGNATSETAARRLAALRPFLSWLQQFEPGTEVPDDSTFGPLPGRGTPHIYHESEIVALLAAARQLGPSDGLRAATYETLFGLIASAGLRISEAIGLADIDVDLDECVLTIRQTKFGKSRLIPLHQSVIAPLANYRVLRRRHVRTTPRMPFFIGSRGLRLGEPLSDRQVHRMFAQLRCQLRWIDRGAHGQPRVHDLRHSFAVRRLTLWHVEGVDVDQRMLALSTYMGHAKISNTYWYLTGVPELMALAGARFERYADVGEFNDE
jgi:integrase